VQGPGVKGQGPGQEASGRREPADFEQAGAGLPIRSQRLCGAQSWAPSRAVRAEISAALDKPRHRVRQTSPRPTLGRAGALSRPAPDSAFRFRPARVTLPARLGTNGGSMVRIGIVGMGFMGMIHFLAARKLKNGRVVAFSTRDKKKLKGDWRSIRGNFGPAGAKMNIKGLRPYAEIDALLADPEIDLVDVCLPTHLHTDVTVRALQAGKHVLVEKPIALAVEDANRMTAAAAAAGKLLMVGQVLPFFPDWAFVLDAARSGRFGKLQAAHFRRIISKPDWSAEMADPKLTGGPAVDLHIHDTHFIQLLCGRPRQVFSRGVCEGDTVLHLETTYLYDGVDAPAVTCSSGGLSQKGQAFTAGFEVYFEKATLMQDFATLGGKPVLSKPLTVLTADGKVRQPKLPGDPVACFAQEVQTAVTAVATNTPAPALSAEGALLALVLCHREIESVKTGRAVDV
jgi:predicted dehydrogenase